MDSRELMVGNYVYQIGRHAEMQLPIEVPKQISQIRMFDVEVNGFNVGENKPNNINLSDLCPIPLTEDILIRCGFECNYRTGYLIKYELPNAPQIECCWNSTFGWHAVIFGKRISDNIELHTLQNIIWLICKQKITLK